MADASIARIEIDEALVTPASTEAAPVLAPAARPRPLWRRLAPVVAATLATALLTSLVAWLLARAIPGPPTTTSRFSIELPPGVLLTPTANFAGRLAISPDGRRIVYTGARAGVTQLYVRALDQLDSVPMRGIAGNAGSSFLSPDGEWVAYNDTASGTFKKMPVAGGPSATICEARAATGGFRGASWGARGLIVFATSGAPGLMQVPDAGGVPEPLTRPDGEVHLQPQFLPDGKALLYTIQRTGTPDRLAVLSLDTHEQHVLLPGSSPHFASSGHLVFLREGALWAVAFDPKRLQVVGSAVPVLEGVAVNGPAATFTLANTGVLVYSPAGGAQVERTLVWVHHDGREDPIAVPPRAYFSARLSPDGTRLALDVRDQEQDIWIWDLLRTTLTRLTFDRENDRGPIWTPDGRRVAFSSNRAGAYNLFWQLADGTGAPERLTESVGAQTPQAFSSDGTRLLLTEVAPKTNADLMVLAVEGQRRTEPLIQTDFVERNGELSPDGRRLAYESNESSRYEIYVRPFPDVQRGNGKSRQVGVRSRSGPAAGASCFTSPPMDASPLQRSRRRRPF